MLLNNKLLCDHSYTTTRTDPPNSIYLSVNAHIYNKIKHILFITCHLTLVNFFQSFAMGVIEETHQHWMKLVNKTFPSESINL